MSEGDRDQGETSPNTTKYWRFLAMIATAMVVMYATTYVNTYDLAHVEFSETRVFMTLIMGSTMALVMLGFMLGMYQDRRANLAIVLGALVVFGLGTWLVRSQSTVQEQSYMRAMIPHHSIAILTSENSEIEDLRVCELAVEISEAQRREIEEMSWLIADISGHGPATSPEEASRRPVPEFEGVALRRCG